MEQQDPERNAKKYCDWTGSAPISPKDPWAGSHGSKGSRQASPKRRFKHGSQDGYEQRFDGIRRRGGKCAQSPVIATQETLKVRPKISSTRDLKLQKGVPHEACFAELPSAAGLQWSPTSYLLFRYLETNDSCQQSYSQRRVSF